MGSSLAPAVAAPAGPSPIAALGRLMFFDPSLSASGRQSCASCHDPLHAYGPPDDAAVQRGGADLDREGLRAVPSLRYTLRRTPAWSRAFTANPAERLLEGNEPPSGGFGWDGRFGTLREQARFSLLATNEMANRDPGEVIRKLRHSAYAKDIAGALGKPLDADPAAAFALVLRALERFELEDPSFQPFTSRYDAFLDGTVALTAREQHGRALFDDPLRGNCASCHPDGKGADGSHPIFTDYQFEALGVPRNPQLRANRDPDHFDEGLCGPLRTDQNHREYCGLFKTPTLRNVALRGTFFHNGRFHTLKEALQFYVQRDTDPGRWYPQAAGATLLKFDDLPAALRGNVDTVDPPLTRHPGQAPAWSDSEVDAVIAFLETLTDRDALPAMPARAPR